MPAALVRHSRRKMRSKVESEQRERFAKIGDYVMEWLGHLGIARSDADKQTDAGRSTGFDVAYLIAEDRAVSGIEPEIGDGLQQHSRLGFAPRVIATVFTDAILRVIRAMIDPGDCGALRFEAIAHPSRQVRIGAFVEIAAADAGLVRHDNDRPPQLVGPETSQIENPGNELELLRPMNVATVHIDDAITTRKSALLGI